MSSAFTAPCDAGVVAAAAPHEAVHSSALLAATILGSSVAFIDGSVVNVALPAIQQSFTASAAATQWPINGYLLPMGALILIGGAMGDRYGRRKMFSIGLGPFTTASPLCALAPNMGLLLTARALQGVGAAPLTATVMAAVDADHVGAASGVNNAIARVGALFATALVGVVLVSDASPALFITPVSNRRVGWRGTRRRGGCERFCASGTCGCGDRCSEVEMKATSKAR